MSFYRYWNRYKKKEGLDGLKDRSKRPHRIHIIDKKIEQKVVQLRKRYQYCPHKIQGTLTNQYNIKVGHMTVYRILCKRGFANFVTELANFERPRYIQDLNSTNDNASKIILQKAIKAIDDYINSVNQMIKRLNLKNNFQNNIKNYTNWVKKRYANYQKNSNKINATSSDFNFLSFISASSLLYSCLFNMDTLTRYPDKLFNYNNLNILKDQDQSCQMIDEMSRDFIVLVENFFSNQF